MKHASECSSRSAYTLILFSGLFWWWSQTGRINEWDKQWSKPFIWQTSIRLETDASLFELLLSCFTLGASSFGGVFHHVRQRGVVHYMSCRLSSYGNLCLHVPTLDTPNIGVWPGRSLFSRSVASAEIWRNFQGHDRWEALQMRQGVCRFLFSSLLFSLPPSASFTSVARLLSPGPLVLHNPLCVFHFKSSSLIARREVTGLNAILAFRRQELRKRRICSFPCVTRYSF